MSWPEEPESLLIGPRGRRLCWSLVQQVGGSGEVQIGPAWDQVGFHSHNAESAELAAELTAAVGRADWDAVTTGMSDAAVVAHLAESVTWAMYWQAPDGVDQVLAHPGVAEVLRPVAHALARAPATRWWSSGAELRTQQCVQPAEGDHPSPALSGAADRLAAWRTATTHWEAAASELPADPAANYSGHWWSAPNLSGLVCTSRALPGLGALQLAVVEDWPGWHQVLCWPMTPRRPARIYEITGPDDWIALVARYPLDVSKSRRHDWWRVTGWPGPWLMPDYAAAASSYDAIHLTAGGYLTTAGNALPVQDAGCLLAGWDPDATYWLADILAAGPPARWVSDDRARLGWSPA